MSEKKHYCNSSVTSYLKKEKPAEHPIISYCGDYTFNYTYPLDHKASFIHSLGLHDTLDSILWLAALDYKKIYNDREKYKIWGHAIEDLVFEGVIIKDKIISFQMGS